MTEPPNDTDDLPDEQLEEVRDRPWRERVVTRSLGTLTQQSLDRALAFIQASVELLEISGESVTVQDVADKAGYSLRVLYRHFSSKEDLLAAALEYMLERAAGQLRRTLSEIEDPVARLAEFVRITVDVEPTRLNLALAKQETSLLLTHPAEVVRAQAPMAALGRELVDACVAVGAINSKIAEHGVYPMMALKSSYNHARLLGDDLGLTLPTQEELVADCLRGLGIILPSASQAPPPSARKRTRTRTQTKR